MTILDLFAHIGLKADTGPANDFLKSINGIKGGLIGAIGGTLSLAAAIREVNASFSETLAMRKFADDTGASVEEMQKWKAVAQQTSGAPGIRRWRRCSALAHRAHPIENLLHQTTLPPTSGVHATGVFTGRCRLPTSCEARRLQGHCTQNQDGMPYRICGMARSWVGEETDVESK